jgi:hypothetical protein
MFHYKDARGLTHTLQGVDDLRLAIAEGRVGPATPLREGDEGWTIARLHPAFQGIAGASRPAGEKSFWELKGIELTQSWPGRVLLIIVTLIGVSAFNTLTGAGGPSRKERSAYHRALAGLSEGDPTAMAALSEPPRSRALRAAWATMMGGRDVLLHMDATQERLGLPDEPPSSWMTNDHILRPGNHPEIGEYWDDLQAYHRMYRDSVLPLNERAIITYAAEAGVRPRQLRPHREALRESLRTIVAIHETALEAAATGRRIHNSLLRFQGHLGIDYSGEIAFPNQFAADAFNREVDALNTLAVRLDSLDAVSSERAKADLARLAP